MLLENANDIEYVEGLRVFDFIVIVRSFRNVERVKVWVFMLTLKELNIENMYCH